MADAVSGLVKSPFSRWVLGGASAISLLLFGGLWVGALITSGFSLADAHTFSAWSYFPMFWPHLAAATLGFMIFLRYGANWGTGLAAVFLWLVGIFSDLIGTIVYWRIGWLCNISGGGTMSALEREMCREENALIISLWVVSTFLLLLAIVGAVAQGLDLFNAGKTGSSLPGMKITFSVVLLGFFGAFAALLFIALWGMNIITTVDSLANIQTYGVWAHINLFSVQLAGTVLTIMMALRYGNTWITAAAAIVISVLAFFSSFYGLLLYWQMGWFCFVSEASPILGIDLLVCSDEENYMIAIWVIVSFLWGISIIVAIAHAVDFTDAGREGSSKKANDSDVEYLGVDETGGLVDGDVGATSEMRYYATSAAPAGTRMITAPAAPAAPGSGGTLVPTKTRSSKTKKPGRSLALTTASSSSTVGLGQHARHRGSGATGLTAGPTTLRRLTHHG